MMHKTRTRDFKNHSKNTSPQDSLNDRLLSYKRENSTVRAYNSLLQIPGNKTKEAS